MKVLITGASGFIGSHVVDELTKCGHDVVLFDIKHSPYIRNGQSMIVGDLADLELLEKTTRKIDCVFHFAAVADIDTANKMPHRTISTNIIGTANLIEACLTNNVKRFIFASTAYVNSNMGGFYASTKKACENIIENYAQTTGLEFTILRYGSLYGPRSGLENGFYRIIANIIKEKEVFTYPGTGNEIRDFIHVVDAAKLSVKCMNSEYAGRILILTGMEKYTVNDLIVLIKEISGKDIRVKFSGNFNDLHYNITPYRYSPTPGEKIVSNTYIDIGQGILELIETIAAEDTN
jgi:UDP-glucose 4-epimerase